MFYILLSPVVFSWLYTQWNRNEAVVVFFHFVIFYRIVNESKFVIFLQAFRNFFIHFLFMLMGVVHEWCNALTCKYRVYCFSSPSMADSLDMNSSLWPEASFCVIRLQMYTILFLCLFKQAEFSYHSPTDASVVSATGNYLKLSDNAEKMTGENYPEKSFFSSWNRWTWRFAGETVAL